MHKKRSPILEKVSSFIKVSISLAKLRKPITLNLIFFKKSHMGSSKKFKLLKHFDYGNNFHEYQFSPCNTPLILRRFDNSNKKTKGRDFYSMLAMCTCLGGFAGQEAREEEMGCYKYSYLSMELANFPAIEDSKFSSGEDEEDEEVMEELSGVEDECSSVDERAERFIEKFYEQMRMQRRDSCLLLRD